MEELFREITGMPSQVTSGHLNRQKTVTVSGDPDRILSILDGVNVG